MKIYLVRHGETPWNRKRRFQGQIDIQMNSVGRHAVELTRRAMQDIAFDHVFASPLARARETAKILMRGKHDPAIVFDDRLKEFGFGSYEGADIVAVGKDKSHPLYNCLWHPDRYVAPEGAESFADLVARARSFVEERILPLDGTDCQNVLVAAHGAIIRAIVVAVGHKDIAEFWKVPYPNCAVTILSLDAGQFTLLEEAQILYVPKGGEAITPIKIPMEDLSSSEK